MMSARDMLLVIPNLATEKLLMEVFEYPSPVLKEPAAQVEIFDLELQRLVDEMLRIMREAPGVGLAATQLGVQRRVIVLQPDEDVPAIAVINPRFVSYSAEVATDEEGCLSFPGIAIPIERPTAVVCEGENVDGTPLRLEAENLVARILQHEVDHLDGILIIDRASAAERRSALKSYREIHGL